MARLNVLMAEAQAQQSAGRFSDAETTYRNIIATNTDYHAAYYALGMLAFNAGKLPLAADLLKAAVALDKKKPIYQRNYGEMCRRLGLVDDAIAAGKAACKLAPTDIDAHYNLGLAYSDAKEYTKAINAYHKALKLNPKHGLSWNNLGSALEQQGDKDAALEAYNTAVALNAQHAEAQNNAGAILSEQGKLDAARVSLQAAIDAKPDFVEAHYNLSSLKTYTTDDPHLALLEQVYANRASLSEHARIRYCFAFGKALDDTGDYDRAFAAYAEGNQIQHALLPMDEDRADAMVTNIIKVFDHNFFAKRASSVTLAMSEDQPKTPIFIVGMPRSGTTLLEQILSSHASVYGAGELVDLSEVVAALSGAQAGQPFSDGVAGLSSKDMQRLGDEYVKRVWMLSPNSDYITDKMPANFFYLGLIHLALPHAKIIHAMRDPMDSCFSCYSRLFNDTMEFAYDQTTLGRYYLRYIQLMQHWHNVLPAGRILDLRYEDMVADTENQSRRVLEFVGLPWDENCLNFHKNDRLVKTASVAQVRKPIYQTSVARWKHFAQHLRPLYALVNAYRESAADDLPLAMAPSADEVHLNAIALYKQNKFDEALVYYNLALNLQPNLVPALNSRGYLLQDLGRMAEAIADFEKAVALAPEFTMARLNLGMAQLKMGEWEQGWQNYEARWTGSAEAHGGSLQQLTSTLPQWDGQSDTQQQSLLVTAEQGFGDTFQFSRYLALAAQRFSKIGFVCSAPTLRLMEWAVGEEVVLFSRMPADYATWDWQCQLMSLPRAFQTRVDNIPAEPPYLKVPKVAQDHWRARLDAVAPKRFRVGIAWAGRKTHHYDARRSMVFEQLLPLLKDARITWVSLQKWAAEEARPNIPDSIDWLDWTEELTDFADSAALMANLDLVLSIDSAMVHLAGALGRPVWMMDRFDNEWRWLDKRDDSPWYKSLRIFRQPDFANWPAVINAVKIALQALPMPTHSAKARQSAAPTAAKSAPSINQLTAEMSAVQAMQLAGQHQSAGRLQQAEQLLQHILQGNPNDAHAIHLLGVVAYQAGKPALALELMAKAIAIEPNVALFNSNFAEMSRQQGLLADAIHYGRCAVALDPSMAAAHGNLGVALYDAKQYDEAETCHQRALALAADMIQSINNIGSIYRARKDLKAAAKWYRRALEVNPNYLESLSNLGAVLVEDDQEDGAVPYLERALSFQANYPEALCNLGLVRIKQDQFDRAIVLLERSLEIKPGYAEALIGLARALQALGRLDESVLLLTQATKNAPDNSDAYCQLGGVYMEQGEAELAEAAYNQALNIDPQMADAIAGLSYLRLEAGNMDAAQSLAIQAIALKPDNLSARFQLTQVKKVKLGDDNFAALAAQVADSENLSDDKRISLHYALGKCYDDTKQYSLAFPHFMAGARIKRAKLSYDADADAARIQRIIDIFDQAYFDARVGAGHPSELPVFVLGMPRSGTTLTEQIIASHPAVHGAGELHDLMAVVQQATSAQIATQNHLPFPENLSQLNQDDISLWGQDYVARLRHRAPNAQRITDKMPANYMALGLIPLMLPNAKIIHVKRNPIDTCVSCFTRLFNRHQEATYDLAELGKHYHNYARLMAHWQQVLPPGSFMEVHYEDIVADIETQARRLIDFIGLEWNDSCLDFHKNTRSIRTASVTQVRQPIYNSSVAKWRNYAQFLGPLLAELPE
jgi:tetratricopeptide (TPR) repeat protein